MKRYRASSGEERIWIGDTEFDEIMEGELRLAGMMPSVEAPAIDVEAFIEDHLKARLDQHADLESVILGVTEFRQGEPPAVLINRDLTGSAMDAEWCPPGTHGRWRATLAHEASHLVFHRQLSEVNRNQTALFATIDQPAQLLRCLKREVFYRAGGSDWREVQANRGMAALLMPKSLFLAIAHQEITDGPDRTLESVTRWLATRFAVSKEAAAIRIQTFGFRVAGGGLFAH